MPKPFIQAWKEIITGPGNDSAVLCNTNVCVCVCGWVGGVGVGVHWIDPVCMTTLDLDLYLQGHSALTQKIVSAL